MNSFAKGGKKGNFSQVPRNQQKKVLELLFSVIIVITWLKYPLQEAFYVFCASTRKIKTEHTALGPICFQGSQLLIRHLVFNEQAYLRGTLQRDLHTSRGQVLL